MHSQPASDTSTQAMTEVALGLSMAFFALLIVALLSFQLPARDVPTNRNDLSAEIAEQTQQKVQLLQGKPSKISAPGNSQFVFFSQGRFIDQQLKPVVLSQLNRSIPLVLAVEQSLSFADVMAIRLKINHPDLSVTLLSKEWQAVLEQH